MTKKKKMTKEKKKNKYLIALPSFRGDNGFNHKTILVSAINKDDAIAIACFLEPGENIGDIKMVDY